MAIVTKISVINRETDIPICLKGGVNNNDKIILITPTDTRIPEKAFL